MKKNFELSIMIALIVVTFTLGVIFICLLNHGSTFLVIGVILALFGFINAMVLIGINNKIIRYKNKIEESLSLIDIQLKLRFDLVPNLVETVKGYAKHEKELLAEVISLRNNAANATKENEKLENANQLLPKLKQMIMLAEDYPTLKADRVFKQLMDDLADIEDRIVAARRIYDSNVAMYNTLIKTFPNSIVANARGFEKAELFKIDTAEKVLPKISFNGENKWFQKRNISKKLLHLLMKMT